MAESAEAAALADLANLKLDEVSDLFLSKRKKCL